MDAMEVDDSTGVLGPRKSEKAGESTPLKVQKLEEASRVTDGGVAEDATPGEQTDAQESDEAAKFEQERVVGIQEFLGDREVGFAGAVKKRYEDFLVNEVDPEGNVVHLTDQEPLDIGFIAQRAATKAAGVDMAAAAGEGADEQLHKQLDELLGAEEAEKLRSFVEETSKLPIQEKKSAKFTLAPCVDKEHRTKVHKAVKALWSQSEGASTRTDDSGRVVMSLGSKGKDTRGGRGPKGQWSNEVPSYVEFVLLKENRDTTRVVSDLCKKLYRKPNAFAYAGTKDRRGVTTQRMTAYRVTPQELLKVTTRDWQLHVGNFKLRDTALKLGQLYGNRFGIVVRDVVSKSPDAIDAAMEFCKAHGFINYYGMQRFGTGHIRTHSVGIQLLKDDYKAAVKLILHPGEPGRPGHEALKEYADTGDVQKALALLPRYGMSIEYTLLSGLKKHGSADFHNAFMMLPRNMRMLYVHAHQAYLWNTLASARIRQFGLKVVVGDLVLVDPTEEAEDVEQESEERTKLKPVKPVAADELEKYSIFDVVVPLPGEGVVFPGNGLEQEFERLLEADGLSRAMYGNHKKYNNYGDYRKLVEKPIDLTWSVESYDDETIPLLQSDKNALLGQAAPTVDKGTKTAVIVQMTLHKSTYATMCLREILKRPTHWNY